MNQTNRIKEAAARGREEMLERAAAAADSNPAIGRLHQASSQTRLLRSLHDDIERRRRRRNRREMLARAAVAAGVAAALAAVSLAVGRAVSER